MERIKNYSMRIANFMVGFRKFLISKQFKSPQEYFQKQRLNHPGWISQFQFQKLVRFSQQASQTSVTFNAMEIIDMFKQLDDGWEQIQLKNFIRVYDSIVQRIPPSTYLIENDLQKQRIRKQQQAKQQQQIRKRQIDKQKQRKNRNIKQALKLLQQFIIQNDPMGLFDQFDQDKSGRLNESQFANLLFGTSIKQFEDKNTRRIVSQQIFSYFPKKQISRQEFIRLFKIPKEKTQKKKQIDFFIPQEKVLPYQMINNQNQNNKIKIKTNLTFDQNQRNHNNQFRTEDKDFLSIDRNNHMNENFKKKTNTKQFDSNNLIPIKKVNTFKQELKQANNFYPQASMYFRNGVPSSEQLPYLQQLQNLISKRMTFQDNQNPATHRGKYYQATSFFKGDSYKLFEMAQSVILRQKSRIGLARQIQPKDIIQGQLGDCYFLSSIASLISIYPEVISQKFLFSENPANYFVLKIFLDGQWKYVVTDHRFPSQNGKSALYAKPHGRQIWAMVIEKCWAKCYRTYQNIASGSPKQGFLALTGAPTQYYSLKSKDTTLEQIQQKIRQAYELRYVVTASGSQFLESFSQQQQQAIGLVKSHAYSFLKFIAPNNIHLVKLRNPWGTRVWKGDWSFESTKWTPELRQKFNYKKSPDDGSFYMTVKDFLKYFGTFVVCKVDPSYTHSSLKRRFIRFKPRYIKMKVQETGKYTLSLFQQNQRKMSLKYQKYRYSPARIIVLTADNFTYIDSFQSSQSYYVSVSADLQEGREYIIIAQFEWKFWEQYAGCLTTYGPGKTLLQEIQVNSNIQFKNTINKNMIESFFKKNRGKIKDYDKYGALGAYSQYLFSIQKGLGYYFITNPSQKKIQLTHTQVSEGLTVMQPDKLPFHFVLSKDSRYLKGFFTSSQGFSYNSSESITY